MKAAVIQKFGDTPGYAEFPDPVAGVGEVPVKVRAVVLENFDKLTASGKYYASIHMFPVFPAIVRHSGIGELEDGTLVTFGGARPPYGENAG
jgi:NADPH2:quinone reductase